MNPLMTFAIFSYNQECFIADAVKSALAQDYSPLQVIISDDCSSDNTFSVIERVVSEYCGPHEVLINKTDENSCTLNHFFEVLDLTKGEILVVAAGDDISKPDRVSSIVSVRLSSESVAFFSNYDLINSKGFITHKNYSPDQSSKLIDIFPIAQNSLDIHGASAAYVVDFLKILPRPTGRYFFEDTYVTFFIYLHERSIMKINSSLVLYRSHASSVSNSFVKSFYSINHVLSDVKKKQLNASFCSKNKLELYSYIYDYIVSCDRTFSFDNKAFENYLSELAFRSKWISLSIFERILFISRCKCDKFVLSWALPRILGLNFFALMRACSLVFYIKKA